MGEEPAMWSFQRYPSSRTVAFQLSSAFFNAHFLRPASPYLNTPLLAYLHDWLLTKVTCHMDSCMTYTPLPLSIPFLVRAHITNNIPYDMPLPHMHSPETSSKKPAVTGGIGYFSGAFLV